MIPAEYEDTGVKTARENLERAARLFTDSYAWYGNSGESTASARRILLETARDYVSAVVSLHLHRIDRPRKK